MGTYLLQQPALLDDIRYRLHLHALGLVDVFERIELPRLLVLDDADLDMTWRFVTQDARPQMEDAPCRMPPCLHTAEE